MGKGEQGWDHGIKGENLEKGRDRMVRGVGKWRKMRACEKRKNRWRKVDEGGERLREVEKC